MWPTTAKSYSDVTASRKYSSNTTSSSNQQTNIWPNSASVTHSSLHDAIRKGSIDALLKALKDGADLEAREKKSGFTALMLACKLNDGESHVEMVDALISAGAEIDARNKSGDTAFLIACRESYTHGATQTKKKSSNGAIIRDLQRRGADVDAVNESVGGILHQAASVGNIFVLCAGADMGADFEVRNKRGQSMIHVAAAACPYGRFWKYVDHFHGQGKLDPFSLDVNGRSGLHYAVEYRNSAALRYFLDGGLDPSSTDHFGESSVDTLERTRAGDRCIFSVDHPTNKYYRAAKMSATMSRKAEKSTAKEIADILLSHHHEALRTEPPPPTTTAAAAKISRCSDGYGSAGSDNLCYSSSDDETKDSIGGESRKSHRGSCGGSVGGSVGGSQYGDHEEAAFYQGELLLQSGSESGGNGDSDDDVFGFRSSSSNSVFTTSSFNELIDNGSNYYDNNNNNNNNYVIIGNNISLRRPVSATNDVDDHKCNCIGGCGGMICAIDDNVDDESWNYGKRDETRREIYADTLIILPPLGGEQQQQQRQFEGLSYSLWGNNSPFDAFSNRFNQRSKLPQLF